MRISYTYEYLTCIYIHTYTHTLVLSLFGLIY